MTRLGGRLALQEWHTSGSHSRPAAKQGHAFVRHLRRERERESRHSIGQEMVEKRSKARGNGASQWEALPPSFARASWETIFAI